MKREQSKAQQQYIQDFFKKKPCQRQVDAVQYSAGQSQSTRQGQVGQQIIPEPGSTGQSRPERASGPHQQPSICSNRTWAMFTKSSLDTHTVCLDNERSWEQVLSVQWFLVIVWLEMSCQALLQCPFYIIPHVLGHMTFPMSPHSRKKIRR